MRVHASVDRDNLPAPGSIPPHPRTGEPLALERHGGRWSVWIRRVR